MKHFATISILLFFFNLFGQDGEFNYEPIRILNASELRDGDTIIYKNILISCMAGIRMETLDSIIFYRNESELKAIYRNINYSLNDLSMSRIVAIEKELWTARNSRSTGYYQYTYRNKSSEVLVHLGESIYWNRLIFEIVYNRFIGFRF